MFLLGVGFTLWGISPVWETTCKRSSSFALNVEEHVRQVYVCNCNTAQTQMLHFTLDTGDMAFSSALLTYLYSSTVSDFMYQKILLPEVPLPTFMATKGPLPCMPPMKKTH